MCEYCEKSKNIYTKDKRSVVYIEWDDCKFDGLNNKQIDFLKGKRNREF